jgi:hypothetical protein
MRSRLLPLVLLVALSATAVSIRVMAQDTARPRQVTFNRDVLPILQKNCQGCHRPGEIGPMSFLTWESTRPWAKAIKAAVLDRKMPPWFAEPGFGHFKYDRRMSDADLRTLSDWADTGSIEGDAKDKPAPIAFNDGWNIKPDMVIEMPMDFDIPATGTVAYQNILVKVNFPEDRWVLSAEMRAGNTQVLHHGRVLVRRPGMEFMKDAVPGKAYETGSLAMATAGAPDTLGKFNPGLGPQDFALFESAKFIPKGSDLVFNLHYTTVGKAAKDRSKVGLVFAKAPPKFRYFMHNGPTGSNLAIPAGASNQQIVSEMTAQVDAQLVYLQPHMHLRGKDYELRLIFPDGKTETIFKAKWDFNWQIGYDLAKPIALPKGTRIVGIAHYDNSANNKFNPDPTKLVMWGDQNWEEMQNCFLGILIDPKIDPTTVFKPSGPSTLPRGASGPTLANLQ